MTRATASTLALFLVLAACGDTEPPATETPELTTPSAPEAFADASKDMSLVPSPVETQRALTSAGIDTELASLIQARTFDVANESQDNVAVRTGVVIADMLLTVKTADKAVLLDQVGQIRAGMTALEGGSDIDAVLADLHERIQADAVSRDELLRELDELSGAVIPELEFNGRERIVPLIKAGSWLEGSNLVARALDAAARPDAANGLLKQPAVVEYFLGYVTTEGADKAPAAVTKKLEESLLVLKGIAQKTEPLVAEDVSTVIQTTNDVLALL